MTVALCSPLEHTAAATRGSGVVVHSVQDRGSLTEHPLSCAGSGGGVLFGSSSSIVGLDLGMLFSHSMV